MMTDNNATGAMDLQEVDRDARETTEWTRDGIAITRHPHRCSGEPTIAGSRITVAHVVALARRFGGDLVRVQAEGLPMRSLTEIRAAMDYYRDHTEEIDAYLDAEKDAREGLPQAPTRR
jgi:uncharacterized protein (DUF433 family)